MEPILFPWEQPEKYENFVQDELGLPSIGAFENPIQQQSDFQPYATFEIVDQKKVVLDGIHVNLDEYEQIIVEGNLVLDGIHCVVEHMPRVKNGKVLVVSKKLVLSGIHVRASGVQTIHGNVRMSGIACKLDKTIPVVGSVKKEGIACRVV